MAHAHHHHHGSARPLTTRDTRRALGAVVGLLALLAVVGTVLLWPATERPVLADALGFSGELVHATATDVENVPCLNTIEADGIRCNRVTIDVTSGPTTGEEAFLELGVTDSTVRISPGDRLVVQYDADNPSGLQYFFQDFQRGRPMVLLGVIFAVAVIALGRWQGVRALLALGVTGLILLGFAFPSILDGNNPTAVALVAAVLIALVALYLTHGITEMITVALLGTFAALGLTAGLAIVFTNLASFTGFGSEDAFYLQFASAQIDVKGLILAGIIVGSLGVLDDVTVTQVSAVWQLHEANPGVSVRRLYSSALTIGRDHIASTVNTLVLAYAGASLPLLLVFAQAGRGVTQVSTGELVAVEIVRTLVGSIGLVAAVPLTTALAAVVVTRGAGGPAAATAEPFAGPAAGEPSAAEPSAAEPSAGPAAGEGASDSTAPPAAWDQFAPQEPERW